MHTLKYMFVSQALLSQTTKIIKNTIETKTTTMHITALTIQYTNPTKIHAFEI